MKILPALLSALALAVITQAAPAQQNDDQESAAGTAAAPAGSVMMQRAVARPFNAPLTAFSAPGGMAFISSGIMLGKLFPPDLIMHHQERLNLSSRQVETIKEEMRRFQSGIVDIQWDLNGAQSKLDRALNQDRIDEKQALDLVDSVMRAENDLKKSHLTLLIRIRNTLEAAQIAELEKLTGFYPATGFTVPAPAHNVLHWRSGP